MARACWRFPLSFVRMAGARYRQDCFNGACWRLESRISSAYHAESVQA